MEDDQKDVDEDAKESASLDDQAKLQQKQKPVKRFRTAFILFSTTKHKEFREKLTAEEERKGDDKLPIQSTEVAKLVSESWRTLPPEERAIWDKKAEDDRKRYQDEINACDNPSMNSKKDPDAPKRPMSAFLSYSNQKRAALKRDSPHLNNGEISKILSKAWKEESEEERQKYIDEARELRKQHKIAVKERNMQIRRLEKEKLKRQRKEEEAEIKRAEQARLGETENEGSDQQSSRSAKGKGKGKGKNNKRSLTGAPKRPVSAFLEYSNGQRAALKRENPSLSNANISKILSDRWKAEDPNVKQRFLDSARDRRVKHKIKLETWQQNNDNQMQDQQQHCITEEEKNSEDITTSDLPTTSDSEGLQEASTPASASAHGSSHPIAPPAVAEDSVITNQGADVIQYITNLQPGILNQSGAATLPDVQPAGVPELQQPVIPYATNQDPAINVVMDSMQEATAAGSSSENPTAITVAGNPPITASQGINGIENMIPLHQHVPPSHHGPVPAMLGIQPGGMPALQQIHPFGAAPPEMGYDSSNMPAVVYIPVLTMPRNPILQGNYPAATLNNNPGAAAAFPMPPIPDAAASMFPFGNNNELNTMPVGARAINNDGPFVHPNDQSLQHARQLLSFQRNFASSNPAIRYEDGMALPNSTVGGNLQQQLMLMRGGQQPPQPPPQPPPRDTEER